MHADMIVVPLIEGPSLTRSPLARETPLRGSLAREHAPARTGQPG